MKKFIISVVILIAVLITSAGAQTTPQTNDTISTESSSPATYRLYPTQNMWTFLKLNTRTGQIWQVQFDTKGDDRFELILSRERLVTSNNEAHDRFALYPTQNIYTFMMIDKTDGRIWQVQWAMESKNRFIIPIL